MIKRKVDDIFIVGFYLMFFALIRREETAKKRRLGLIKPSLYKRSVNAAGMLNSSMKDSPMRELSKTER